MRFTITKEHSHEFTVYKCGGTAPGYDVDLDGENIGFDTSLVAAHKLIKGWARASGLAGAGVTEVFGRNRQFTITPRYGFKKHTPTQETP